MRKKLSLPVFILFNWVCYGFLIALSVWVQVFPQEFKSLIINGKVSENIVIFIFAKYLILSTLIFSLLNAFIFHLEYSNLKKNGFKWNRFFLKQIKAARPIYLLSLSFLRVFVSIGDQPAWFDQTVFYFVVFFILISSWTFLNLSKGIFPLIEKSFNFKKIRMWLLITLILSIIYFGYFSTLRCFDLSVEKPDSHAFINLFWNTARGNSLRYTYLGGPRNWFGLHFEPLVFIFVPIYLAKIPFLVTPIILQLIQVIIGISGIIPVFLLARKKLSSDFLGLIFGLVYLLYPAFQFQLLYDFHIEIISLVSTLWSIYLLEQKKYKPFLIFLSLAILSREEFSLYASVFGLFCLLKKSYHKKLGVFLLIIGLSYFLLVKFVIIPHFGQGNFVPAQASMFSHLGNSFSEMVKTFFYKFDYILNFMFTQRKIQYLFLMFLPVGFLALLSPLVLFSLPFFALNLLLNFDLPSSIFWHYQSWLIPVIIWSTLVCIFERGKNKFNLCYFVFFTSFLSSLYFGPLDLLDFNLGNTHKRLFDLKKNVTINRLEKVRQLIPEGKSLASDTGLAPFFADRQDFYLFPDKMDTDYIVTSLKLFKNHFQLHPFLINNGYCLKSVGEILVYKKQEKCDPSWQDDLVADEQPFKDKKAKIIFAKDIFLPSFPIFPRQLDLPAILILKFSLAKNLSSENIAYFVNYQMLADYPSLIKIEASKNGKNYKKMAVCSAIPSGRCIFLFDASKFLNDRGEIYLKLYLFADSLAVETPDQVRVEGLNWFSLKFLKNSKTELDEVISE